MINDNIPMLENAKIVAFVGTLNADRALTFYRDTLGLRLVDNNPFAMVFDVDGTMLRVTPVPAMTVEKFTVLGFHVTDIMEEMRRLNAKSVVFERYPGMDQDQQGIWTSPTGASIAWFKDPDGNVLSLSQF
jgi:catechol 2,3-dioxygenase-like lactoylglutathione lyase family enzyme